MKRRNEWTSKRNREKYREKEGEERKRERILSGSCSCGCQLNVPGQLCSWPSNDLSVSPAFNLLYHGGASARQRTFGPD